MFRIFEYHVDRLVLQYDFLESDNVFMGYLPVKLFRIEEGQRDRRDLLTAISRTALWLIPVYVTISPSLSGLNFLIA
jgi:hypothetical protein